MGVEGLSDGIVVGLLPGRLRGLFSRGLDRVRSVRPKGARNNQGDTVLEGTCHAFVLYQLDQNFSAVIGFLSFGGKTLPCDLKDGGAMDFITVVLDHVKVSLKALLNSDVQSPELCRPFAFLVKTGIGFHESFGFLGTLRVLVLASIVALVEERTEEKI